MNKLKLESILNEWGIFNPSERWSIKSMFNYYYPSNATEGNLIDFLEKKKGAKEKKIVRWTSLIT